MASMGGRMGGGGRMETRRGHSPLELGSEVLRPVSFFAVSWKPFLNAHWGFAQGGLACEPSPRYSPGPGYSLRLLPYAGADAWGWLRWEGGEFGKRLKSTIMLSMDIHRSIMSTQGEFSAKPWR